METLNLEDERGRPEDSKMPAKGTYGIRDAGLRDGIKDAKFPSRG